MIVQNEGAVMSLTSRTVSIYTLGCKVNQYESEAIAEGLTSRGFSVVPFSQVCDAYIINTCTVTAESDRKARQLIRRAIKTNPSAYILVTGCMAEVFSDKIAKIDGVDYICGNGRKLQVIEAIEKLFAQGHKNTSPEISISPLDSFEEMQIAKFDRTRAYIKIEDGCENRCTYCIIPEARGKVRSKAPSDVLSEVRTLTDGGCREIVLTGIETASYGRDFDNDYRLADLLEEVDAIPNIGRIRLGSLDPSLMKPDFVNRIAKLKSLTPHFHLSMQSGSDKILALMKRKYNQKMALEGMERLRAAMPEVQFTTDIIVGFPGETEEDFALTVDFAKQAKFLMIHVFPYSERRGTVATTLPGRVPEEIRHERVRRLSAAQAEIQKKILDSYTDTAVSVLFETYTKGIAIGHTDTFVEVSCPAPHALQSQLHTVYITGNDGKTCTGVLCPCQNEQTRGK
jgi:threonylcarbamoyladenosine tRNA methylthiotransferase MtaB